MVDLGADIGFPQWVFGQSSYAFLDDGRVAFAYSEGGLEQLAVRRGGQRSRRHGRRPAPSFDGLRAHGRRVVCIAAGPTTEPHVVEIDVDAGGVDVLVPPRDLGLGRRRGSPGPDPINFPTAGGGTAHALLYRPANPDVAGARRMSGRRCW